MKNKQEGGFIQMILLVLGGLIILKYAYHIDVVDYLTTGIFKEWLDKIYSWGTEGWLKYRDTIMSVVGFVKDFIKEKIFNK